MSSFWIILLIVAAVLFYLWSVYNQLVTLKTRIKASIQEIANQLKRQADLIPNLIATVKGYMAHEDKIFTELTEARKAVMAATETSDPQQLIEAGSRLQTALAPLRVVVESTPQIQAAGPSTQLMTELTDTADKVMYSRRTLIDLTADYNIRISTFPSNMVANLFSFKAEQGLHLPEENASVEVKTEDLKTPQVSL